MLDAQVVGTSMRLGFHHAQKKKKYSLPDLLNQVREGYSNAPRVSTITLNFRGVWAPESAHDLKSMGLTDDLKLIAIRCLQGGAQCFQLHRRMTTVVKATDKEADTLPARSGLPPTQVGGRTLGPSAHNQSARTS